MSQSCISLEALLATMQSGVEWSITPDIFVPPGVFFDQKFDLFLLAVSSFDDIFDHFLTPSSTAFSKVWTSRSGELSPACCERRELRVSSVEAGWL